MLSKGWVIICDYKAVTFAANSNNLNLAKDFIYNYSQQERILAYKFVYWYFTKHAYDVYDQTSEERLMDYLKTVL